jgi:hypothetical protein
VHSKSTNRNRQTRRERVSSEEYDYNSQSSEEKEGSRPQRSSSTQSDLYRNSSRSKIERVRNSSRSQRERYEQSPEARSNRAKGSSNRRPPSFRSRETIEHLDELEGQSRRYRRSEEETASEFANEASDERVDNRRHRKDEKNEAKKQKVSGESFEMKPLSIKEKRALEALNYRPPTDREGDVLVANWMDYLDEGDLGDEIFRKTSKRAMDELVKQTKKLSKLMKAFSQGQYPCIDDEGNMMEEIEYHEEGRAPIDNRSKKLFRRIISQRHAKLNR